MYDDKQMPEWLRKSLNGPGSTNQTMTQQQPKQPQQPTNNAWGNQGINPSLTTKTDNGFKMNDPWGGKNYDPGFQAKAPQQPQSFTGPKPPTSPFGTGPTGYVTNKAPQQAQTQQVQDRWKNLYNPTTQVDNRYIQQAGEETFKTGKKTTEGFDIYARGDSFMSPEQLREAAFYFQNIGNTRNDIYNMTMDEVGKLHGISSDFTKANLAPLYSNIYGMEDYMRNYLGYGSSSNNYLLDGTSRDELGYNFDDANGFRVHDTRGEWDAQQALLQQGYNPQAAYQMVRQIDPYTRYSPTNQFTADDGTGNYQFNIERLLQYLASLGGGQ